MEMVAEKTSQCAEARLAEKLRFRQSCVMQSEIFESQWGQFIIFLMVWVEDASFTSGDIFIFKAPTLGNLDIEDECDDSIEVD